MSSLFWLKVVSFQCFFLFLQTKYMIMAEMKVVWYVPGTKTSDFFDGCAKDESFRNALVFFFSWLFKIRKIMTGVFYIYYNTLFLTKQKSSATYTHGWVTSYRIFQNFHTFLRCSSSDHCMVLQFKTLIIKAHMKLNNFIRAGKGWELKEKLKLNFNFWMISV